MAGWFGWAGRVLWVDLAKEKIRKEPLQKSLAKEYLGARGFNSACLFRLVNRGIDALSPENVLMFGVSPLAGTFAPSACRFTVTAKSPLTDIFGDSNCGGYFDSELKYAGYDQIVVTGKAKHPVYLWIDDDHTELKNAGHLTGKSTWETQKIIRHELGEPDLQVACIGPAGENMVRFACIIHTLKRAAGRTGMGAVMGSKNLKAVVVRGTKGVKVAEPQAFEKACRDATEALKRHPFYATLSEYGTPLLMEDLNATGMLGTRNYESAVWDKAEEVGGEKLKEEYSAKMRGCFACPIHCTHFYVVNHGKFARTWGEGPEFAHTSLSGNKTGISDMPALLYMNNLANQYGLDVASLGSMIAWAMDCYSRAIISKEDADGLPLEWGNSESAIELVHRIATRQGFGNILAEGEKRAPKIVGKGSQNYMYEVKGMSPVIEDPRATKLFGFGYVTSVRGGDHLKGFGVLDCIGDVDAAQQLFGIPEVADPLSTRGKGAAMKWHEDFCAAQDAAGICRFASMHIWFGVPPNTIAKLVSTATGAELDETGLFTIGERIYNLEKAFNSREGLTRKDDNFSVPKKFLEEPLKDGPARGSVLDLDPMLDEYYDARGWDRKTGLQSRRKLEELDLKDIANELQSESTAIKSPSK